MGTGDYPEMPHPAPPAPPLPGSCSLVTSQVPHPGSGQEGTGGLSPLGKSRSRVLPALTLTVPSTHILPLAWPPSAPPNALQSPESSWSHTLGPVTPCPQVRALSRAPSIQPGVLPPLGRLPWGPAAVALSCREGTAHPHLQPALSKVW